MTSSIMLYARKEPTVDTLARALGLGHKLDVVLYKDPACSEFYARWSWHLGPPRLGRKFVMLNCYRWAIAWISTTRPQDSITAPGAL